MLNTLLDQYGRTVHYLRLSITDRCNLRCSYCRVGVEKFIPHEQILRYEELLDLIRLATSLGIEKVRLTGGEPFARKGFIDFLSNIRRLFPQLDLRLTTNGTMLLPYIQELKDLNVAINLSLDSFDPANFTKITGRDLLPKVLYTIDALLAAEVPLKINAVAMRGINDHELPNFINFALTHPVQVRFIEFMPMGADTSWSQNSFWAAPDILAAAKQLTPLKPLSPDHKNHGPAKLYALTEGLGYLGLITPLSNHFCNTCNRLRITSDGYLRTCLFDDKQYKLISILRHPKLSPQQRLEQVRKILCQAILQKPLGTQILSQRQAQKRMTAIGG